MTGPRRRLVDLSHRIRAGMVTYPGFPGPSVTAHLTREASREHYAPGTEFEIDRVEMLGNTGTYLDSPFHRYASGVDLAGIPLERVADLPATVLHLADAWSAERRGIGAPVFADGELEGAAVLVHTGWASRFGTDAYGVGAPFLTAEAAELLAASGAALVGIDAVNIDDTEGGGERPAHSTLLAAGIPVVEHLTHLEAVPARGARFFALPPAFEGVGTFPVRAVALLSD